MGVLGAETTKFEQSFWGIYRSPTQFLDWAKELEHPKAGSSGLDDALIIALFDLLRLGHLEIASRRARTIKGWLKRAVELSEQEDLFHRRMNPRVQKLLSNKRLLLFRELAHEAGCKDSELINDVAEGHELTGLARDTKTFKSKLRPPNMSKASLLASAKWTRRAIIGSIRSSGDADLDKQLYAETLSDRQSGWLDGPYSESEIEAEVGEHWVASRRFGIIQNGKLRSIDDLSESFVNASYGTFESVNLGGVDEVVALSKLLLDAVSDKGCVELVLSDGKRLSGKIHSSFTVEGARVLVGRSLDLKSAYKQQAINPSSYNVSVTAVFDPESSSCKLFIQRALPFGSSASVLAFNRISRAIWRIGVVHLSLLWTS